VILAEQYKGDKLVALIETSKAKTVGKVVSKGKTNASRGVKEAIAVIYKLPW